MNGSRMMSREALADFSIIALLAGVIVYVAASLFGTKERLNISVALHPSTPGAADCMIDVDDSKPLKAKRTHQVSWSISNTCTDAYVVKADTFQPRLQAGGLGPAEGILEKPAESKPIDKTGGQISPLAVIRETDGQVTYKYRITIQKDGTANIIERDPDIEIWP